MAKIKTEVVVIGGGPAGYTAAFRAADLGKSVTIVEQHSNLGGVCLNVGCIPSKTLLHAAKVQEEIEHLQTLGITKAKVDLDPKALIAHKNKVINTLATGLKALASKRKIKVINGSASFIDEHTIKVADDTISFENAIIAVGSRPVSLPFIPKHKRVLDSTSALDLPFPKANMLVIGGGIIGLEMTNIYHSLGAKITIVELGSSIIAEADADIVKAYSKHLSKKVKNLYLNTKVVKVEPQKDFVTVHFQNDEKTFTENFDTVLVAIGRVPNSDNIGLENLNIELEHKFIKVNKKLQTNLSHIYAIGDVAGHPMLAHKGLHEAKISAENICDMNHYFEPKAIPSVAYTNPEIAWTGKTESQLKKEQIEYKTGIFPLAASGRALSQGASSGFAKLIFDASNNIIIGGCVFAPNAGDLIAEITLAIEMGCDAEDIALTIHAHPTLSEVIHGATEVALKSVTDLLN